MGQKINKSKNKEKIAKFGSVAPPTNTQKTKMALVIILLTHLLISL